MTFYLKPPRGLIELDKMIECLQQRLEFITSIQESSVEFVPRHNITYFVEGTAIDRASHYLLRLVSAKSRNFQSHVLEAETALFKKRLKYMDHEHLEKLLQTCHQHSQEILNSSSKSIDTKYSHFLASISNLCQDLLRKPGGIKHIFGEKGDKNHPECCRSMYIRVPYRTCLKLVAERKVDLRNGEAHVPCGVWKDLLVAIFNLHLQYGYSEMILSGCQKYAFQDPRMSQLTKFMEFKYKEMMTNPSILGHKVLMSADVWKHRHLFPPCISHLLDTLQEHHRLGHHARIALTLFLKEAGMPVQQALEFWRSQYSIPGCKHGPSCSHSWQDDERKFTYSVRHLYGLEGARKNYASPCCSSIQEQLLAPNAVGGCPFTRFPTSKLLPLLKLDDVSVQDKSDNSVPNKSEISSCTKTVGTTEQDKQQILSLASSGKSSMACQQLLMSRVQSLKQDDPHCKFSKPAHFYVICRDWSKEF